MSNTRQYEQGDIVDIHLFQDGVQFSFTVKLGALANGNISANMLTGDIEAVEQLALDQQLEQSVSEQSDITSQLLLIEADLWSKIAREHVSAVLADDIAREHISDALADDIADAFRQRYLGE